jgi:hypothetical protein
MNESSQSGAKIYQFPIRFKLLETVFDKRTGEIGQVVKVFKDDRYIVEFHSTPEGLKTISVMNGEELDLMKFSRSRADV